MNLEFEIYNKTLRRKNIKILTNPDSSQCVFTFVTHDWVDVEKYAIFWDNKDKSTIKYLGKGDFCRCTVPEEVLKENLFSVQVYANDDLVTQKLKFGTIPKGYTIKKPSKCNNNQQTDPERMLYDVFNRLESKIDNIIYEDGFLKCYADRKLVLKTPIFMNLRTEIRRNIKELMPYFEVEENGDIYAIYPDAKGD